MISTKIIGRASFLKMPVSSQCLYFHAKKHAVILTYGTYYMLNKPIWRDPMNVKYRYLTEKRFQEYYRKHKELIRSIDPRAENEIIRGAKTRVLGEGVLLENFTFDAWIRHIEEL